METRGSYRSRPRSGSASTRRLEKRKQKCLWVSDNSRSILSRCWVLAGKEGCVRSTSALEPPPRSHYPRVWKVNTICRAQVPQGSGVLRVWPLLASARRAPLVPRARRPPPGPAPPPRPRWSSGHCNFSPGVSTGPLGTKLGPPARPRSPQVLRTSPRPPALCRSRPPRSPNFQTATF